VITTNKIITNPVQINKKNESFIDLSFKERVIPVSRYPIIAVKIETIFIRCDLTHSILVSNNQFSHSILFCIKI
jgi:hypothetical protein